MRLSAAIAVVAWMSGYLLHAGIISKRIKISSNVFLGLVAHHYGFLTPHMVTKF